MLLVEVQKGDREPEIVLPVGLLDSWAKGTGGITPPHLILAGAEIRTLPVRAILEVWESL